MTAAQISRPVVILAPLLAQQVPQPVGALTAAQMSRPVVILLRVAPLLAQQVPQPEVVLSLLPVSAFQPTLE